MSRLLAFALLSLAGPRRAPMFSASNDMTITGQTGVGTAVPRRAWRSSSPARTCMPCACRAPNGAPLLVVDKAGLTGIGLSSPGALLERQRARRRGRHRLQLRSATTSSTVTRISQIVFAYDSSGTYATACARAR